MGDFNFDNEINFRNAPGEIENVALNQIMPEAIDTWDYVNPESKSSGKTYDSGMISHPPSLTLSPFLHPTSSLLSFL